MTVLDVLKLLDENGVPCTKINDGSILPDTSCKVSIRYMSEKETWIDTYPSHPILRQVYDKPVDSLDPDDDSTLGIWIKSEDWL